MTGPERALWSILRSRQLAHLKFRRQHPIGPYVVDFYCHSARIAVELDGLSHDDTAEADAQRSAYLQLNGVRIVRVLNDDAISDPGVVAEWIATEAAKLVTAGKNGIPMSGPTALTPALSRRERERLM
jgi:very-short-patch-repair endonuclease